MISQAQLEEMPLVRELFQEYADGLGFDLAFQSFADELDGLPGFYAPPQGCILLARLDGQPVGCIAMRCLGDGACEMKRLFVRPAGRSRGLGRQLCVELIARARAAGYAEMKLDTVSKLQTAIDLYRELGFEPCERYCDNPQPDVQFFSLRL
ncbi:MAG: GNAT family N-acetyltransferase [Vulcanimicrobiota bacterium]